MGHLENTLYVQEKGSKNHRSFLQTGLSREEAGVPASPMYARGRRAASPKEIFSPLRLKVPTEAAVSLQILPGGESFMEGLFGNSENDTS